MVDHPDDSDHNTDPHDEEIHEKFNRLDTIAVPDVWSLVDRGQGTDSSERQVLRHHRGSGRWILAAAAVALALVAVSLGGALDRDQEAVVIAAAGTVPLPTSTASADAAPATTPPAGKCDSDDLAERLGRGVPRFSYETSESLQALASRSSGVVRGSILQIENEADGSIISFKTFGTLGEAANVRAIWIPAALADTAVRADFVAFLGGVVGAGRAADSPEAWIPEPEGFWVACDDTSPAASVLATPEGESWEAALDDGLSIDDLWMAGHFPNGEVVTDLTSDLVEGGSTIFDLKLVTGDRLRLSVPSDRVGDGLRMTERAGPEPVVVSGTDLTITIASPTCSASSGDVDPDAGEADRAGPTADVPDAGVIYSMCWSDQALSLEVMTPDFRLLEVDDGAAWELRVITSGARYGAVLGEYWPYDPNCSSCPPTGPLRFNPGTSDDVIVHTVAGTQVRAMAGDTLATRWTVDYDTTPGAPIRLHGLTEMIIVEVLDGPLIALDPETGDELWSIDRRAGERDVALSRHGEDGPLLVRSSFSTDGDDAAPVLRRIDASTGEVSWSALGSQGAEWADARPEIFDDVVIMLQAGRPFVDEGAGRVSAFDLETGAPIWSQALFGRGDPAQPEAIAKVEFEFGQALVLLTAWGDAVRLDPQDAQIIFRSNVGASSISGTDLSADGTLALALDTDEGLVLLDPVTGALVEPQTD